MRAASRVWSRRKAPFVLADLPELLWPNPVDRAQMPAEETRRRLMTSNDPRTVRPVDISSDDAASTEGRREILRMHYRGWFADVDGCKITLPTQCWRPGMVPADLMVCLEAAATEARANKPRPVPSPEPDAPILHGVTVAKTMRLLRRIAADRWHPFKCDIYECISLAWEQSGMEVAHADLVRNVRAALPDQGESLMEFNDTHRREHMLALLDRAVHRAELAADHVESAHMKAASGKQSVA